MSRIARRALISGGVVAAAGLGAVGLSRGWVRAGGLVPPDCRGPYGAGETLTYAAQRILTAHSMAREFDRGMISKAPFANTVRGLDAGFREREAGGFRDWKLAVDGMVARPGAFSLADLRALPVGRQITEVACEEGWSYIAEWIGTPLYEVLHEVGVMPGARYVVYFSAEKGWWESVDMADAMHPQTLVTMGMNDGDLPVGFGGPLRLRVPRQLGYKSVKFIERVTVTDSMKGFGEGLGSASPEAGYSWWGGI